MARAEEETVKINLTIRIHTQGDGTRGTSGSEDLYGLIEADSFVTPAQLAAARQCLQDRGIWFRLNSSWDTPARTVLLADLITRAEGDGA